MFSLTYIRTLLERIKPFRIVSLKSGLHVLPLSEGKHHNNGGPK